MNTREVVRLQSVQKSFRLGETYVHALRGLSLSIQAGEFTAVIGASGSGKSTLLNMIGGIDRPDSGVVEIGGYVWQDLSEKDKSRLRNRLLGFVFQSFNLMPMLNVFENVEVPLLLNEEIGSAARKKRVMDLLQDVGLSEFAKQRPDKLSGGQRQRVAIARALVTEPLIVIADEPTANLDSETTRQVITMMQELNRKKQVTFIFSTHDEKLMSQVSRVLRMRDGMIVDEVRNKSHEVAHA